MAAKMKFIPLHIPLRAPAIENVSWRNWEWRNVFILHAWSIIWCLSPSLPRIKKNDIKIPAPLALHLGPVTCWKQIAQTWTSIHPSTCWLPSADPPSSPSSKVTPANPCQLDHGKLQHLGREGRFTISGAAHHSWLSTGQQQMQGQTSEVWVEHEAISDRNGRNGQLIGAKSHILSVELKYQPLDE